MKAYRMIMVAALVLAAALPASAQTYVLRVAVYGDADVAALSDVGYIVDHVQDGTAELYLDPDQFAVVRASGRSYTLLEIQGEGFGKAVYTGTTLGTYPSFAAYTQMLQAYAGTYSDICELVSLGTSVDGLALWALHVSDNVGFEEAEPEFKYVSTMHGDEPVGTVLLLYLIDEMLSGYGNVQRFTTLIDETDIWFMPLMNPDGYVDIRRTNDNSIDLNRNFPVFGAQYTGTIYSGAPLLTNGRQPETVAIMNWTAQNSFVLSANLHTGALVVNYPYDYVPGIPSGSYAIAPDDDLLIEIAALYAEQNAPMLNNPAFPGGIVNGSDWFAVDDGMQDWNYRYAGNIEMTLELNNIKRPNQAALPGLWNDNRESLIRYMEAVHRGVRGVVTDADTAEPLYARITVEGNSQPVFSDPDVGDYYRLLLPGTYAITAEAAGYVSQTVENVPVSAGLPTELNFSLNQNSEFDANGDGTLDAADVQYVINAVLGVGPVQGADVNDDAVINASDIQSVINALLN